MKILIDMNLSPGFVPLFRAEGWDARHWSDVGAPDAPDRTLMDWARQSGFIVLTNDLDFGAILAATGAIGPSVFQVRTQDLIPAVIGPRMITLLRRFQDELDRGALIVVDEIRNRVRKLPLAL